MKANKPVLIWLIIGATLVAAMVVIGGITRLTNSGLSMVEWKLIMGAVPPLSDSEWQATFEMYQQFPEYIKVNSHFTLAEFKSIFWWEYSHRLLGRIIGIVFLIPFIVFWIRGYFKELGTWKYLLLFAGGGFQGFLGWFMVKSGLINNPDVSHYRLAIHLMAALLLFSYIVWLIISIIEPKKSSMSLPLYKWMLWLVFSLTLLQITFGAFVAGLNAGLFYPTYPTMNGEWLPIVIKQNLENDGWLSLTNGIASVQFIHRWLGATLIFVLIGIGYVFGPSLQPSQRRSFSILVGAISLQIVLGISALLLSVPFIIAVLHQFMALIILTLIIINLRRAHF